jgi:lauroyl/myristoyl acyltransferase/ADP-heptose:LPS heptosyltransferase
MLRAFLATLGFSLAAMPVAVPAAIARVVGWLIFHAYRSRRHTVLSNLRHAFPERSEAWRRDIGLESCRRTVEMGLFVLASPFFDEKRIHEMFQLDDGCIAHPERIPQERGVSGVVLVPHFSLMESTTLIRVICDGLLRADIEMGVLYRPFKNAAIERWVKDTRERFGTRLLSRREGFGEASNILRRNGRVGILPDQHAGNAGSRALFMGRLASTSSLAGLLAEKHRAGVAVMFTRRTGFWRGKLCFAPLLPAPASAPEAKGSSEDNKGNDSAQPGYAKQVTIAGNIWLEKKIRGDDNFCADWLWLHKRWKVAREARVRFTLRESRHDLLAENIAALGCSECPRNEYFWLRLPDRLSGVLLTVPLLRALRKSRPDAALILLAPASVAPLLEATGLAERVIRLPAGLAADEGRFTRFFKNLHGEYPDTFVCMANDARFDREAALVGAPQRFGMSAAKTFFKRRRLTHVWTPPKGVDPARLQQTRLWERWWQVAHGLSEAADVAPLRLQLAKSAAPLTALLIGAEGDPRKSWPVERWREFAGRLLATRPEARFRLLGASNVADRAVARAVAEALPQNSVQDWTGKLGIEELARALAECHCVVGNDNGFLHLANMLGVPAVGLFGPTNPLRGAPVFATPLALVQPIGSPQTGGTAIADISVEQVLRAREMLGQG